MFDIINALRSFIGGISGGNNDHPKEAQPQEKIEAQSGSNVRFYNGTDISQNYGNALSDAIRFYQNEFHMTPHANIANDPEALPNDNITGAATLTPDKTGQYGIDFRYLTEGDEEEGRESSKLGERTKSHPKNSGDIGSVPVHELGHALFGTLFPSDDTSSNREGEYSNEKFYSVLADDVYFDALEDIGVKDDDEKAIEKTKEISGYANANPSEAVAESLVDYYYNRDNAAPLSKAIVKKLKSKGATYSIKQTGGFDLDSSADNFVKNLRRYRVIQ